MQERKDQIVSAILTARAELEKALYGIETLPIVGEDSVSFAAHALNNFLTVTAGTVELLQLSLADHPNPQVHTWLRALQQATNMMAHTVTQLMNASNDRKASLRFEKVDLAIMIKHFLKFYQFIGARKQILCLSGSSIEASAVWTDRIATGVVLENLLSNAVKYSPPGKRIWVELSTEPDWVVCSVRDEGPGLSQEDQAKLFRRGTRLTPRPTGTETSTGYGLAVAKELIDSLGGTIWCESALGKGSCFSFRLPCYRDQQDEPICDVHRHYE